MGRRDKEEPEWDSEESGDSSAEDSDFEDEEGSEDSEDMSGSEEESGSEEDESGSEEDESGSEDDESESEEDSEDSDVSDSDDYSSDDGETTDRDEELEDIEFFDEEQKGRSSTRSFLNEPDTRPFWAKLVPAKIAAKGAAASAACICLMILVPLSLIIGLSVGLTRGDEEEVTKTSPPTASPTPAPTLPPTIPPAIKSITLAPKATNTIYREGIAFETSSGAEETMLVQRGPLGDLELPSAYSLVQFDGIAGIDTGIMSFEDYLDSIEGLEVEMCLKVASTGSVDPVTYSTCLLPPDSAPLAIEELSGSSAPQYDLPIDCLNDQAIEFVVEPSATEVCVDVTELVTMSEIIESDTNTTEPDSDAALRGRRRRRLEPEEEEPEPKTYLFMIDTLQESDAPGTRFYSSNDPEGRAPFLYFAGDNTCFTAGKFSVLGWRFSAFVRGGFRALACTEVSRRDPWSRSPALLSRGNCFAYLTGTIRCRFFLFLVILRRYQPMWYVPILILRRCASLSRRRK